MKITVDDVKEYWNSQLFPEFSLDADNELDAHFKRILGKSLEQLAEEYIANSDRKDRVFNTSYSESLFTFKVKQNIPLFNFFAPLISSAMS